MLVELHIRDFAIIEELHLTFPPGFTVLTGETGAGKSIIVDALELALGGRADGSLIRAGADRALIEATFRLNPAHRSRLAPLLEREGLEGDTPDLLLLGREVRATGRSIPRVNGRAVTLALLREVSESLVDIHGQSEHLSLLRVREHVNLLDRYGGLGEQRARVAALVRRIRAVRRELAHLIQDEQELAHRADLLRFQIDEIQAAGLRPDEEEELQEERLRLANAEQLTALVAESLRILDEGEDGLPSLAELLGNALRALEGLARVDSSQAPLVQTAEAIGYRVEELVDGLREYRERIEYNPARLQEVEERLALIRRLERKYGPTIAEVLAYSERAVQELDSIVHSGERVAELQAEEERLLGDLGAAALELSRRRQEAARQMAAGIERELDDLRMAGARFEVAFGHKEAADGVPVAGKGRLAFDGTGIDRVEFLISPNPGEPPKPLVKIASGGETARLMLALKTVLSRADETETLVFDEIDQGIGGRIGATVGRKLWELTDASQDGVRHQVLCVTHLPQLAAFGDAHFRVEKRVQGGRTTTQVHRLTGDARVEELAQMLGGSGEAVRRSAAEILSQAQETKAAWRPSNAS